MLMSRRELEIVLDYILNKADATEFEVIAKACQRRGRDLKAFESLGGEGPNAMARRLAGELETGVGATMENVRGTVRAFVADIVRKNAPEVTEEQLAALLDEYAPPMSSPSGGLIGELTREPSGERLADDRRKKAVSPLPPDAVLGMVSSFLEYSRGAMAPSRQRELWEASPRWQDEYWAAFPPDAKALIKAYLEGKMSDDTFGSAILSVLGL